jgi:hypothetical protein
MGEYEDGPYGLAQWDLIPNISIRRGGIQFPMAEQIVLEMETDMRTNEEILTEAENLRRQAERLEEIAAERGRYGADPFKNGTVLKVDMKYRTGNRSYAYAVIKVGGRFYLSGRMSGPSTLDTPHSSGYTWDNFVAWLAQGDATVWQATGLKQVL